MPHICVQGNGQQQGPVLRKCGLGVRLKQCSYFRWADEVDLDAAEEGYTMNMMKLHGELETVEAPPVVADRDLDEDLWQVLGAQAFPE